MADRGRPLYVFPLLISTNFSRESLGLGAGSVETKRFFTDNHNDVTQVCAETELMWRQFTLPVGKPTICLTTRALLPLLDFLAEY